MIGFLQRVTQAAVRVEHNVVAHIDRGIVVLVGIERADTEIQADRLCERILSYRVFPDAQGHLNFSVAAIQGGVLVVPQFTLAADTRKGTRADFGTAAAPAAARILFDYFLDKTRSQYAHVASGVFGADMKLSLINDGPVSFWLQTTGVSKV